MELLNPTAIDYELAERHLADYIRLAWPLIETTSYKHNWHIDVISEHLELVARGKLTGTLVINISFRCMKSLMVNVFFPTWTWAQNPDPGNTNHGMPLRPDTWMGPGCKFLCASHSMPIALRDALKSRRILEHSWYQNQWGDRVSFTSDQNQKTRYENTKSGFRVASAAQGMLGEGGDVLISDDPLNRETANSQNEAVREGVNDWWDQTFSTRTNDPERTVKILIMQRLHERDVSGHVLSKEDDVTYIMLPMEYEPARACYTKFKTSVGSQEPVKARFVRSKGLWVPEGTEAPVGVDLDELNATEPQLVYKNDPRTEEGELFWAERFSKKRVESLKITLGPYGASGQFQQSPSPKEGGLFERHLFVLVDAIPAGTIFCRGWDLAATEGSKRTKAGSPPAASAGMLLGMTPQKQVIICNGIRLFGSPGQVDTAIINTANLDKAAYPGVVTSIPQDPGQAGKSQVYQFATKLHGHNIHTSPESGDKVERARPLSSQLFAGNVLLLKGHWNEAFLEEVCAFPNAQHKDRVDAMSRAYLNLVTRLEGSQNAQTGVYHNG